VEVEMLLDFAYGLIVVVVGFVVKRIFVITDRLAESDRQLHSRITDAQMSFVSKKDFEVQVERIISAINRLEAKIEK
jgi:hypothetical protein